MKIRSNVVSLHLARERQFTRDYPLGRNTSTKSPHRDPRLSYPLAGHGAQLVREGCLPSGGPDHQLDTERKGILVRFADYFGGDGGHMLPAFNTDSVIEVNTRSVFDLRQTSSMPKRGVTSEFWDRLTRARSSCNPPKSMRQEDIASEYGAAFQSTVTKWKTGKSKPSPDTVEKMARDTNVNVNWLWAGQGDMRPLAPTDPIVRHIIEAVNALMDPDAKVKVLEAAIAQKALQRPEIAAQIQQAQAEARKHNDDIAATSGRKRRVSSPRV